MPPLSSSAIKPSTRLKLEAAFAAADKDRSGEVDVGELRGLLKQLGVERTEAECHELVKRVDIDSSGELSIEEVAQLFEVAKLKATFEELDSDGSGSIAAAELSDALKKLGYRVPEKQCLELLKKVDTNNDGQVSFDEFVAFFEFVPIASLGSIARLATTSPPSPPPPLPPLPPRLVTTTVVATMTKTTTNKSPDGSSRARRRFRPRTARAG